MTAAEKKKQLRNRASLGSTGEAFSTQTAEEKASATPVARKDTVPDGATASGKTKQKKPTTAAGDVERILLADFGSSDDEDESESTTRAPETSGAFCVGPPTSAPTLSTVAAAPPTSRPTSSAGPYNTNTWPPTGARTANQYWQMGAETNGQYGKQVADEGEHVGDEDPCFVGDGNADKETALDSESEESSSEIGEFDEDEDEEEELWELVCPSDEEEGDAAEELPDKCREARGGNPESSAQSRS
ncbi:hypothetical protein PHYSODRAFT_297377 [Phytophthora sojae]|uniref:Uncharacterized protein n=1 Tax=Phytophthora sojae (strain P6497) TaxID=1094619 RepID=G4Z1I6_PHYSP|nr:hypothetical protein PHYSODRAFT_297377 [Phytophthora sojae]EGZ25897.1 hypothetical protein PHYSODRAFT_297377 [Phytophthora sojae]|eukprot:XP_009521185.1 hypothetical protein PHYSODRAFT_297377 [Phytophthora sojae]